MKRIIAFLLTSIILVCSMISPLMSKAEENTTWKMWPSKTEVDTDKEWVINFNKEIDWLDLTRNISIIREKDNKQIFIDPVMNDNKSVKLYISKLYDFDETYYLLIEGGKSIDGNPLKEPIKMKFQTANPEFNFKKTVEQDGIKFEALLNTKELDPGGKVYAKIKATNVSTESIPYWGGSPCDLGFSANVFSESQNGQVMKGDKWNNKLMCPTIPVQYFLEPGETIEVTEVLYPTSNQVIENSYIKVIFDKGLLDGASSLTPIEIPIGIQEFE